MLSRKALLVLKLLRMKDKYESSLQYTCYVNYQRRAKKFTPEIEKFSLGYSVILNLLKKHFTDSIKNEIANYNYFKKWNQKKIKKLES